MTVTALLRLGAFLANAATVAGIALFFGAGWLTVFAACVAFFALAWWGCGLAPPTTEAPPEAIALARAIAQRMGATAPRSVRSLAGNSAAAIRDGFGYSLLLGREVLPEHAEALLAHEVAHHVGGDLVWEPLTDGPARLLLPAAHACAPVWVLLLPFLPFAVTLARRTELLADRRAAEVVSSYSSTLEEVTGAKGRRGSLMYPSVARRLRHSARDSWPRRGRHNSPL